MPGLQRRALSFGLPRSERPCGLRTRSRGRSRGCRSRRPGRPCRCASWLAEDRAEPGGHRASAGRRNAGPGLVVAVLRSRRRRGAEAAEAVLRHPDRLARALRRRRRPTAPQGREPCASATPDPKRPGASGFVLSLGRRRRQQGAGLRRGARPAGRGGDLRLVLVDRRGTPGRSRPWRAAWRAEHLGS